MEEEDDDFYEPNPASTGGAPPVHSTPSNPATVEGAKASAKDLEEGEEEEEEGEEDEEVDESDSDIDIITDRKDATKSIQQSQPSRFPAIRNLPQRTTSTDPVPKTATPPLKTATPIKVTPPKSGADFPAVRSSKIDVDAVPEYEGKRLTELDIDEDLKEHDKPWRVPGTDVSDYFNYGFDEFTWSLYCLKQEKTRADVQEDKKGFSMAMDGGSMGMPGLMPSAPGAAQGGMGMPPMPGMGDMPPEMMAQMMAQMMGSGVDPSQMDPSMFGMQAAMGASNGGNPQGQGFGSGQQNFGGQGQNGQQMGFGFDSSMMAGDAGRGRQGNFGGRGRGGNRRNW
ncbi:MAG: hypothetical protein M1817_005410 [Caeruleum heppii]|nr:MAG: hypothetical protein M1817_005410 [Caeruleum heppii]